MANRRMLTSDLFMDDVFIHLTDIARLIWIGLVVIVADDQGRMQDNHLLIKSQVFPADNKTPAVVAKALECLIEHGLVVRYQKQGKNLLQIVNWWKHQTPSWASPSAYPEPDGWLDREKYHSTGNKIVTKNWDTKGGYQPVDSELSSQLDSELPSSIENVKSDVKDDVKDNVKDNSEIEDDSDDNDGAPEGGPSVSGQQLDDLCDYFKLKSGKIAPADVGVLAELLKVFRPGDIKRGIDHMLTRTDRPNTGLLGKVLKDWSQERKIHKVYG